MAGSYSHATTDAGNLRSNESCVSVTSEPPEWRDWDKLYREVHGG